MKNISHVERDKISSIKRAIAEKILIMSKGVSGKDLSLIINIPESKISTIKNSPDSLSIEFLKIVRWRVESESQRIAKLGGIE